MPKVFISDIWVLNIINKNYFETLDFIPWGIMENFVFNCLLNKFEEDQIYYYRTISKAEIDFVLSIQNELIPIEVKFRNYVKSMPVAIHNFVNTYSKTAKRKIIITKNTLKFINNEVFLPYYLLPFIRIGDE